MEVLHAHKVLLDAPCADEPVEDTDASSLVVRPTAARTTERLLAHHSTSAFLVVINVSGSIAEPVGGGEKCLALGGEAIRESHQRWITEKTLDEKTYIAPVKAYSVVVSIKSRVFS